MSNRDRLIMYFLKNKYLKDDDLPIFKEISYEYINYGASQNDSKKALAIDLDNILYDISTNSYNKNLVTVSNWLMELIFYFHVEDDNYLFTMFNYELECHVGIKYEKKLYPTQFTELYKIITNDFYLYNLIPIKTI